MSDKTPQQVFAEECQAEIRDQGNDTALCELAKTFYNESAKHKYTYHSAGWAARSSSCPRTWSPCRS